MILTLILLFLPVLLLSGLEYYRSCLCRLDTVRSYHLKFSEDGNQTRPHGKGKKKEKKRKEKKSGSKSSYLNDYIQSLLDLGLGVYVVRLQMV